MKFKVKGALVVVVLGIAGFLAAGCDRVTSESIQSWKTTQKGPIRLEEALKDPSVSPKLRAEAAAALVDTDRPDKVDAIMAAMASTERWDIVKTLVPIYTAGLAAKDINKMRAARDALFGIRGYAPPEEQKHIDAAVLPALEKDLQAGRFAGGRHSVEKMLIAIGPASGPMLVRLLAAPDAPYPGIVDLLAKVADQDSREKAGAALLRRAGIGKPMPLALWKALGALSSKTTSDFLIAKVERGSEADAVAAAQALQQSQRPTLLPMALRLAGDPKTAKGVRDEMFGLAERIGGLVARDGLVHIVATDPAELVRYRAYEAALVAGNVGAIGPALEAFPAKESYKRDDVVDYLAKDIGKLARNKQDRPAVIAAIKKTLSSQVPLARMVAVLAFEDIGGMADVAALRKLASDTATIKGFPPGASVGKEAVRVAAVLEKGGKR